jgi:hypothetical protein
MLSDPAHLMALASVVAAIVLAAEILAVATVQLGINWITADTTDDDGEVRGPWN